MRANAKDGVYIVTGASGNQDVVLKFEKVEGVTYELIVSDGENALTADVILVNVNDGSAYYISRAAGKRGCELNIPAGTYEVRVKVEGDD